MTPLLASFCFGVAILVLSRLARNNTRPVSWALWIPLAWLLIGSSRPLSEWFLGLQQGANYEEGTPLDRTVLTILLALGLYVLYQRMPRVKAILRANLPIILFFLYCLASVLWSDFPFVTFKRWTRGAADVVMILVIITDPYWESSFKWLFTRIAFLLIPLSVLIIRFFPEYGRSYTASGAQMWTGVCTDKNALGAICMIFGPALLWQMLPLSASPIPKRVRRRQLIAKASVFAMAIYLIWVIDSKTALICFLLANTLIVLPWIGRTFRKRAVLTIVVTAMILSCYCVLFLGMGSGALKEMGRKQDLTGRKEIWAAVLPLATNPFLGTGYEDFWMGKRFEIVARTLARLNQAHNGYLEIYLNLGWIGLILLGAVIVTGYRNLMRGFRDNFEMGRLKLAFFTICLVYNFTEATFKMQSPVWITFLWAAMGAPKPSFRVQRVTPTISKADVLPAERNSTLATSSHPGDRIATL
jgi:exopolysaccharide production protein ExoQ